MTNHMPRLEHFIRNDAPLPAAYDEGSVLPPRETFTGHGAILDAHDALTRVQAAYSEHMRAATDKRAKARTAAADYRAKVAEAMRTGADPAKIKDQTARLEAEAEAHDGFAADAKSEARQVGARLGQLVQESAAEFFAPTEDAMAKAAERIAEHVTALTEAWEEWGAAWGLRFHLSQVGNRGGTGQQYRPQAVPQAVAQALGTVAATLDDLAALKAEEDELARWRDMQAQARATNARATA